MKPNDFADKILADAITAVGSKLELAWTPNILANYMPLVMAHMDAQLRVSQQMMLETQLGQLAKSLTVSRLDDDGHTAGVNTMLGDMGHD